MSVVTRFAPSPTGFLHIGGARTALFNWLYARRHGGRYLLRIEDTDRARSTPEAIAAILDGLDWLGLHADAAPIYQFARAGRHAEIAHAMIDRGTAFRCYVTPAELEARRAAGDAARARLAEAKNDPDVSAETLASLQAQAVELTRAFRSPYRNGDMAPPAPDAPFVVRLRAPDSGEIVNADLVQGTVRVRADDLDDLVLLRADGTPTYMLAVVVDDHDMGVTHVIRGDDHLTNAARQIPIFEAMGWHAPVYAHIPLIHGPDGAKLSKRHGALAVQAYREMGYLPEGLTNYLMRLGWSHGDQEIMSLDEAAAVFDLDAVGKGPSRLDFDKLAFVNAHWLRHADEARLVQLTLERLQAEGVSPDEAEIARIVRAMPALKGRARTIVELAGACRFLVGRRPLALDASAEKALKPETRALLARLGRELAAVPDDRWTDTELSAALKAFVAAEGVSMGQIGPGLRAALTGGAPAPDLSLVLSALGRDESLARMADQSR